MTICVSPTLAGVHFGDIPNLAEYSAACQAQYGIQYGACA